MKKNFWIFFTAALVLIIIVAELVSTLWVRNRAQNGRAQTVENVRLVNDDNIHQVKKEPDIDSKEPAADSRKAEEGSTFNQGGSIDVICYESALLDTATGKIEMFYENPINSTNGVLLELYIGEYKIAETGIIPPGYSLEKMGILPNVVVKPGNYAGYYLIKVVNADTGEVGIINPKVNIQVFAS